MVRLTNPEYINSNLLRDGNGKIISDNITWITSNDEKSVLETIEFMGNNVKESHVEGVKFSFEHVSGNYWIRLFTERNLNDEELWNMQKEYSELYREGYDFWHRKYEEFRNERLKERLTKRRNGASQSA